ncbi:MAG: hypothetical protein ACOCS7_02120 [Halolamina sp.]
MSADRPQHCPRCGSKTPDHGAYCPDCGADLFGYDASSEAAAGQGGSQDPSDGPTRRQFLLGGALVGSVAAGGLFVGWREFRQTSRTRHTVYGEGWDVERSSGPQSASLEGQVTVPAGRYAARFFDPDVSVTYSIAFDVQSGGPIDLLFMEDDEYERYRDRDDDVQVLSALTAFDSATAALEETVAAGEYTLVVDNTSVYGTSPDGEAVVDLLITADVA